MKIAHSIFVVCIALSFQGPDLSAQETRETETNSAPKVETVENEATAEKGVGVVIAKPTESVWEFGVRVVSQGRSRGITATAPIPNDWPEQEIEVISKETTSNVARVSIKKLQQNGRQVLVKINQLNNQEVAEAYLRIRVKKSFINNPRQPAKLMIARKLPSSIKQYLRPSPLIESNHPRIKKIAKEIVFDENKTDFEKIEQIFKWVRENIEYKFAKQNYSCLQALDQGHGDCGELTSLFIAICRAKGIPARAIWIPQHTYPEFYMTDEKGNEHWIPCQIAGSYQFGNMPEARPILQKGDRFKIPGESKPARYIKPTCVAKDSQGGISFSEISREAKSDSTPENKPKK